MRIAVLAVAAMFLVPGPARAQQPSPSPSPDAGASTSSDGGGLRHRVTRTVDVALTDHEPGGSGLHWGPLYPAVSIPGTGTGPGPTLHVWAPALAGSKVDLHASATYSWRRGQYYDVQLGALPHRGRHKPVLSTGTDSVYPMSDIFKTAGLRRFDLYVNVRRRVFPRQAFYGLGPATDEDQRSDYTLRDTLIEVVSEYRLTSWLTLAARAGLLRSRLGPGRDDSTLDTQDLFDDASAPGLLQQPSYAHASAGLLVDTRDVPGNPRRGGAFGVAVTRYDDSKGHDFQFNRFTAEGRRYRSLGRRHVVALHVLASFDQADRGSRVPFYLQSALGGAHVLRGFRTFRFRDEDLLALSAEYRFDLAPRVELAAFYDAGKVFPGIGDLDFKNIATSWGAGVRLKTPTKVRLRLDVAHGNEGTRFLVKFGPAF